MNFNCPANSDLWKRLDALVSSRLSGELAESQVAELERLLGESDEAAELYVELIEMSVLLPRALAADESPADTIAFDTSLSTLHSPLSTPFVGGPVFSYMVASVVLCLMLLGAWAYKISHDEMVVQDKPAINSIEDSEYKVVGRVSDMKDCVWPKDGLVTMVGASVPMGRKYSLESGLLEITYTGGAKVILEGPCEYTADSRDGGFLRVGKLVARVEKQVASGQWPVARKEGKGEREEGRDGLVASAASEKLLATSHWPLATDPQFPAPSPRSPLSTLHSPLFTITTPTAIVTDLGTEFGVKVDENGDTASYVFLGSIKVRAAEGLAASAKSGTASAETVLRENESIRVSRVGKTDQNTTTTELVRFTYPARMPEFVRKMHEPPELHKYAKMILADAPLFYWTFDESSGPAIEQIRGLSHQKLYPVRGATRCDHAAIDSGLALGRAADFSGAAGVFASNRLRQARSMPGAWAIEFWVQATGEREQGAGQYVMNAGIGARPPDYRDNPSVIFNWPRNAERNELQLFYPEREPTHDGPILANDKWHHVIFVFYGHENSFGVTPRVDAAVDGRRRTIDRGNFGSMFSLEGQLCVGAAKQDLSHAFRGRIDELAFYDMSRMTVEQIEARIDDMAQRHFAAARSDPAKVNEAGNAPSKTATSILGEKRDKRESVNAVIKGGKEQQPMGP